MNIFQKYTKRTNSRLTKIFALLMFPIACSLLGCGWGGSIASSGNTATTTTLIASSSTVSYGSSLTLTASILPSTAAGTVTLYDGLTSIGSGTAISGVATLSLTSLAVGSHSITAVYGGSATYTTHRAPSQSRSHQVPRSPQHPPPWSPLQLRRQWVRASL